MPNQNRSNPALDYRFYGGSFEATLLENYYGGLDLTFTKGLQPSVGAKVFTPNNVEYTVESINHNIIKMVGKIKR